MTVDFMVIEKSGAEGAKGLGQYSFKSAPRKGEIITFNNDEGIGQAYEVIAVMHPLEQAECAGDLIIKHIGTDLDFRTSL